MFVYRSMMVVVTLLACLLCLTVQAFAQTPTPIPFQEAEQALLDVLPAYEDADVVETETGLRYVILEEGAGELIEACDTVSTHYTAYLADGTQFDTSLGRPPFSFVAGTERVIEGWEEGIELLQLQSKAILMIPPDLGYGAQVNNGIPANSTLYFDLEVVDVTHAESPTDIEAEATLENGITYATIVSGTELVTDDEVVFLAYSLWETEGCLVSETAQNDFIIAFQPDGDQVISPIISGTAGIRLGEVRQMFWPAAVMIESGFEPISYTVEVEAINVFPAPSDTPAMITATEYITGQRGVEYVTLREGDGAEIEPNVTYNLVYHVWTAAGESIYSSLYSGNEVVPYTYLQNQIAGFDEALQGARVGELRQAIIPAGVAGPDLNGVSSEVTIQIEIVPDAEVTAVGLTHQGSRNGDLFGVVAAVFVCLTLLFGISMNDEL